MNDDWAYLSKSEGIGGEIKISADEFIVEEIALDGAVLELNEKVEKPDLDSAPDAEGKGKFTHFILQKRDWSTSSAIKRISKALRVGQKRFDYAGTKDKVAHSTQMVSVFGVGKEQLLSLQLKDMQINGAWAAREKVRMGDLLGNRFCIKWHGEVADAEEKVSRISAELDGKFPNYFGPQRFGSIRKNTHRVGELILRRRFQEAAMHFLAEMGDEENEQARVARSHLLDTNDFSLAMREFPKHLKLERSMLAHLVEHPTDYIGAFRRLPRQTLLMFIHAFQSWLFNESLSARIRDGMVRKEDGEIYCGSNSYGFPETEKAGVDFLCGKLLGYDSEPNEREKEILARHEISLSDFEIKGMPELSSKGGFRPLLCPFRDFEFREGTFAFSLPSGAYATSALREFMKKE